MNKQGTNPVKFFKATKEVDEDKPIFNSINVMEKLQAGITTHVLLDANVLNRMKVVVDSGNNNKYLKMNGLRNFVNSMNKAPRAYISPISFHEMPPAQAAKKTKIFDLFCKSHMPSFFDDPEQIRPEFKGKDSDYCFTDLDRESQFFHAYTYNSLLLLQITYRSNSLGPLNKFKHYCDLLEERVGIMGYHYLKIAQYCFFNHDKPHSEFGRLQSMLKKNFLGTSGKKTSSQIKKLSFNAAFDMALLSYANFLGSDEYADVWIASADKKLEVFCDQFGHVNLDGQHGKFATSLLSPDEFKGDFYWAATNAEIFTRLARRRGIEIKNSFRAEQQVLLSEALENEVVDIF